MYDDLFLFIHIAREQGLAGAARKLGLPPATVTRRLKKLESDLGCQLVHRTARKFALTAEGESYLAALAEPVAQMEETVRRLSQDIHQLSGPLKVAAPTNISVGPLKTVWSDFAKDHPSIQLALMINNEVQDLLANQIDLALRAGPQQDSQLMQSKLGWTQTILVASASYLSAQGIPGSLKDLKDHKHITLSTIASWQLTHGETGEQQPCQPVSTTLVNDLALASQFARDGHGIALIPVSEVAEDLREGRLIRVLAPWSGPVREIYAVWPSGRLLSARAKCLRDYLRDRIAAMPILQGDIPG